MVSILKYLKSEGGYISAAMALGSMIMNGVMGGQAQKRVTKLSHKTGEEQNLQDFLGANSPYNGTNLVQQQGPVLGNLADAMEAARGGGLMPAIGEAFSQRPSTPELNSIAAQERQLKNAALNSGARGGLLRQQMFEAGKNAAMNKMNVMENSRQNALQRAFQIFQPMAPTQNVNMALNQQQLQGLGHEADLGVARNQMALGSASKNAQGTGSGLGSILGGLGNMIPGLTTSAGGFGSLFPDFMQPGGGMGGAGSWLPFTSTDYGNLNPGQVVM